MSEDVQAIADQRFQEALEETGIRDPRDFYRERLRELRTSNPDAYGKGVAHFREVLIPSIAGGDADPITAWLEYGILLAELTAPGRLVTLDATGKAGPRPASLTGRELLLHLPTDQKQKAIVVGLPPELSDAQRATFDLLVKGKQKLPGA
jgi:hypothetical protein